MNHPHSILTWIAAVFLSLQPARSGPVEDWNERFIAGIRLETTPPVLGARSLAILHLAMHDAVAMTGGKYRPLMPHDNKPDATASTIAAVAAAAHEVACALYPGRRADFDALLASQLDAVPPDGKRDRGLGMGRLCAAHWLEARRDDGSTTTVPYVPSAAPGQWQRTTQNRPPELSHWGAVKPFFLTSASAFRPPGPPAMNSNKWTDNFEEVRRLGAKHSAERTAEQALTARFWSDFSYTSTPPGHWNQIARALTAERKFSLADSVRLFAVLNAALADAGIACWEAKYHCNFWRPVTAIHRAAEDGNNATAQDAAWESLLPAPSHPEYISGHSAFSAAAAGVLEHFFHGDRITFTVTSDALPGERRQFRSFSECVNEIGRSRVFAGIHFSCSCADGITVGRAVAGEVIKRCDALSPE